MASCVCVPPDATNISVLPRLQYLTLPSARSFEEDGRFLSSLVTTVKHRFGEDFRFTRLDCRQNFDISVYEQGESLILNENCCLANLDYSTEAR